MSEPTYLYVGSYISYVGIFHVLLVCRKGATESRGIWHAYAGSGGMKLYLGVWSRLTSCPYNHGASKWMMGHVCTLSPTRPAWLQWRKHDKSTSGDIGNSADKTPVVKSCTVSRGPPLDRKSTRLNSSHITRSRMPSSA